MKNKPVFAVRDNQSKFCKYFCCLARIFSLYTEENIFYALGQTNCLRNVNILITLLYNAFMVCSAVEKKKVKTNSITIELIGKQED